MRLVQGDFDRETVYGDPVETARAFVAEGARHLHIVDLDAARTGHAVNSDVVAAIAAAVKVPVQAGGGVRDEGAAEALFEAGVERVVVGTAAIENPNLVHALAKRFPGRVVLGLDHRRHNRLAVRGWRQGSGASLVEVLHHFERSGVTSVVVTDISRDGMQLGPDLEGLAEVLAETSLEIIASGGVGCVDHLLSLGTLERGGRRLRGAVVGKAIYDGVLSVREALSACERSG